ncbi:MAG TPA: AsmA-like C-terminal region-containing protein [Chthoniobacterales bacterium]
MNFFLVAVLLTAIWGGWYVSHRGFGKKWRGKVAEEFSRHGTEFTVRRLTLDPLRGLVAKDVRIFKGSKEGPFVARIDQLNLDINYTKLIRQEPFINALEMRHAELALPQDPDRPKKGVVRVQNLQARISFPPGRVEIRQLEGDVGGVHLSLTGVLRNPDQFKAQNIERPTLGPKVPGSAENAPPGIDLFKEFRHVTFAGKPATFSMQISGDLAKPESLQVDHARFNAGEIRWREILLRDVLMQGDYVGGRLAVHRFEWSDDRGGVEASAAWNLLSGEGSASLQAGIDWLAALRSVAPKPEWAQVFLPGPAELRMNVAWSKTRTPHWQIVGSVKTGPAGWRDIHFESAQAAFSWDGQRWMMRDLDLEHRSGSLTGHILAQPERVQAAIVSNLDPEIFTPLIPEKGLRIWSMFDFRSQPLVDLKIDGPGFDPKTWKYHAGVHLGRTVFRGVPLNSGHAVVGVTDRRVDFENIQVVRDEGIATGSISWDLDDETIAIRNVQGTLDPAAVCSWISAPLARRVSPYRFRQSPWTKVDGAVRLHGKPGTDLTVDIAAPTGMDYTFLKQELPFDQVTGRLAFTHRQMRITNLEGKLFGGTVRGGAEIALGANGGPYSASISLRDVDFPTTTNLYIGYTGSEGKLTGHYEFKGNGKDPHSMTGSGEVRVEEGNVFTIPVFGPLSGVLDKVMPGFAYNKARKATASFTVANGVLTTDDLELSGQGVNLYGAGAVGFLDDTLDFTMRVNARGLPGFVLDPVSKLFEFHSSGPLKKPVWKLKHLPGNGRFEGPHAIPMRPLSSVTPQNKDTARLLP